jgi:hypothetical protein
MKLSERRLQEFVDREREMRVFRDRVLPGSRPILAISGDGGLGKSSLLARMEHECAAARLRKIEVVWTDTRRYDALAIMRKIRDDTVVEGFGRFTELVNYFFQPPAHRMRVEVQVAGSIRVASGATIDGSHVGDVAGLIFKDAMFVVPRADLDVPREVRMAQITDAFLTDLAEVCAVDPLVMFFDAIEKMSEETLRWVGSELVRAVAEDRLPNVRVVLLGRLRPAFDRDISRVIEEAQLRPLALEDIDEYLGRRGVGVSIRGELAKLLLVTTGGNPLNVACYTDAYLNMTERDAAAHG